MLFKAIFIDRGHGLGPSGGKDDGARGSGTTERAELLPVAQALLDLLCHLPLTVVPVGITERLSVADKVRQVNARCKREGWGPQDCLLVSLHMNSGPPQARGLE